MGDWIKLHRKIIECPIFANEKLLKVWLWCLCKATYKDKEVLVGNQIIHLTKGQFIFGRMSAARELNIKDRTVYDYMRSLENCHMLRINSNNKFSVVTIEKWADYQDCTDDFQQQTNNKPTTNQQQTNTNNNIKNIKNIKNNINNNIEQKEVAIFFDAIWKLYPRKKGKGKIGYAQKKKLYNIGYDKIVKCIELYVADTGGKDEQYIMYGSTFFNSGYVDYLDKVEQTKEENSGWHGEPKGYWQSVDD